MNFLCFSERRVERAREFECWVKHFLPKDVLTSKQGLSTFGEPSGHNRSVRAAKRAKVKLCCGETRAKIEGKTRRGAKGASRGGFPLPEPAT